MSDARIRQKDNPRLVEAEIPILDESGFDSGAGFFERHVPYGKFEDLLEYNYNGVLEAPKLRRQGYKINQRDFGSIKSLFSEDYKRFEFSYEDSDGVYIGFEHCDKNSSDEELRHKKCNETIFGNLEAKLNKEDVIVMGSSMGHTHPLNLELQEAYEFHGNGAMVLQSEEGINLAFLRKGRKILVPGNCDMTIYNLSLNPLETFDFANPRQNESNKEKVRQKGAVFCIYYNPIMQDMHFKLNSAYSNFNSEDLDIAVHIPAVLINELPDFAGDGRLKEKFKKIGVNLIHYDELNQLILPSMLLEDAVKTDEIKEIFGIK